MPYNGKTFSDEPVTETFYFPLTIQMEDEDCEDLFEVSSSSVRWFEDEIQEAIDDYQSDINMTQYLCDDNDEIQHKLISAKWGVETMNGDIYGRVDFELKEPFTDEETRLVKEAVSGQNSDGMGEGFEQYPITLDGEDYYVSFWNSGDDYFVYTADEMDEYLSQQTGQGFSGM